MFPDIVRRILKCVWFKFEDDATFPTLGTASSAGYDLYSYEDKVIKSGERALVQTNIGVILPVGYYGRIAPRSSLAYKHGIDVFAGVIDNDYRGKIGVILYNSGSDDLKIQRNDRVAQLILTPYAWDSQSENLTLDEAQKRDEWNTQRGAGGYGSTGL